MMDFPEQDCLWWAPAFRQQQTDSGGSRFCIQVRKYYPDHRGVFDTGNYLDGTATFAAGVDVDKVN